jgi:signal peptidase II
MAGWRGGKPAGPLSPLGLGVVAAVVILDQIAKFAAAVYLPLGEAIDLLPILTLYRVANTGIAFSFFAGSGFGLIVVMFVVSAVVIAFWARTHEGGRLVAIGFALILGGAIGNLIDRVRLGHVVDFLLLHVGDWTLFVFNLADAALTLGAALLILVYLFPGNGELGRQR